ncbi:MAG TPA: glutamyl-tRNA reductase, partial [Gammaproteobacteria bacterium]|nr:glutamyl-tRNA reductase [Gammaproteobacteria bacterium]
PHRRTTTPMPFFSLGISHATAPVAIRERLSFGPEQVPQALREITTLPGVAEAALLSTCNRTEIYAWLDRPDGAEQLSTWLMHARTPDDPDVARRFYRHHDDDAARHLFRVACGLDSMILGEPQILGQIKGAYALAQQQHTAHGQLHRLFQYGFSVAKQIRTDTRIGENPVSVAFTATHLARRIFSDFNKLTALLIGAGETIELVARHLREQGTGRMVIANRTVSRAHALAEQFGGYAIGLHEIPAHLAEIDIVIASTGSPEIVLTRATAAAAFGARKRRPVLMVDIAVPRDIESSVATLNDVYLFTIDDLQNVIEENLRSRQQAAAEADALIEAHVRRFGEQLQELNAVPVIRAVREHAGDLRDETLEQARQMLRNGHSADEVMHFLADTLTNRLLHAPTAYLREAAQAGREHIVKEARALFGLDRDPSHKD